MSASRRSGDPTRACQPRGAWPRAAAPLACLLLVVLTVAAYSNSLRCAFVFDDGNDILKNTSIKRLWPIWQVFVGDYGGKPKFHNRPIANVTLALNYATGGFETLHYHLTNLGIHVLAALTLFGIARRTFRLPGLSERYGVAATPLAFAVAATWALHPLQTQAVTYIVQRYESLAGLLYLVTLYCALRSDSSRHPRWWMAGSISACLLAVGCKEIVVSAPLFVLLYDRAFLAGSFREAWRRRWGLYVGLAATWLALAAQLKFSGSRGSWAGWSLPTPWNDYAVSQFGVILHYLRLSFWPYPQVFDYGWPVARRAMEIVPGALVVGALLTVTAYALIYWPRWGTLGAWFFLILAPTSSVMPIADLAFEHRMYLPLAAVVTVTVLAAHAGLERLLASSRSPPWWGLCARAAPLVAVLTALGVATHLRNRVYQSEWSIWNDTVQKAPLNARAHFNLGYTLFVQGKNDVALAHYQRAVQLNPRVPGTHCALAFFLEQQGRTDEAVAYYRKALRIDPRSMEAHHNLALILRRQGKVDEAITHFRTAIEINPDYADAHYNLGNVLCEQGRLDEAVGHYRTSLGIQPGVANVHFRLGSALAQQGKLEEAIVHYRKALEINPSFTDAGLFLNRALRMQREMQEGGYRWKVDRPVAPK